MPVPETTYYNVKRLHVVFAVSSLALLAVTVWMVAADHWREWKVYQRTYRDRVEPWLTEAWIRERQTDGFTAAEGALEEALAKARMAVPDRDLIERFCEAVEAEASARGAGGSDCAAIDAAYEALVAQPSVEAREKLLAGLSKSAAAARNRRENLDRQLRFRRAEFDEARSFYEAGVGEGLSEEKLNELQSRIDRVKEDMDILTVRSEKASPHYETLSGLLGEITAPEDDAREALADHRAAVARLDLALAEQRPRFGKKLLRMPILEAFGRPLAVDQIWLPELTIDYNFRRVARFDRCTTCHQGIDKTVPGSPSEPACLGQWGVTLELAVPAQPQLQLDEKNGELAAAGIGAEPTLEKLYGLTLASRGILDADLATIGAVVPRTPGADAGLLPGDVILEIDEVEITGREEATRRLLEAAVKSQPSGDDERAEEEGGVEGLKLQIRRGLGHPYCSHPRLDLFVGSLSPHPMSEFGCTICHGGQGSATAFKFASHTPNDPEERARWRREHGWFWNEHWDFPMRPARFVESSCLGCHHAVTDLAPSRRFPDPPAPKLLAGYQLIRQHGCFGCHEIKGVGPSGEPVGPDMRLEPNYHEAALDVAAGTKLTDEQGSLVRQIIQHPEDLEPRRQLVASLAVDSSAGGGTESGPFSAPQAAALKVLAADDPTPGTMRKVGPSLRDAAGKLDAVFLDEWLRNPELFRPDTRMPRFYGLWEHLDGQSLSDAKRFEAAEIYAMTDYLLAQSQPVESLESPPEVTEPPSAERGKRLFLTQGCAACHKHGDLPKARSVQGPNLSRLGPKLNTEVGRQWLVSWVRDPARYSPRTLMPNTLLEPVPLGSEDEDGGEDADGDAAENEARQAGEGGAASPRMTDPAADVAAYLLQAADADIGQEERRPLVEADLDELVLLHLSQAISGRRAQEYLAGACELTGEEARGDAIELVGRVTREKKVRYLGRRTLRKRGCFGCHDVSGLEDAKPIGPALSDWGRKQESLLAFEQIHQFLAKSSAALDDPAEAEGSTAQSEETLAGEEADRGFYVEALLSQRREGFLWQKLRAPRSFDYKKTENKGYNEQLTMGRFTLTPGEREAIITFVLGLVADPPAEKYVYQGDRRRRAIAEGRKVLDRYACAECHTLEMERWRVQYDPEELERPYAVDDFAFNVPRIDIGKLEAWAQPDRRGLLHAEAVGMPQMDEWGEVLEDVDDDDNPMYYLNLWEPLGLKVLDRWMVWPVGGAQLGVSDPVEVAARPPGREAAVPLTVQQQRCPTYTPHLTQIRAPEGGAFARLLFPEVLDEDNAAVMEAWGWVPPPLVNEGGKVQPAWLHDYLLEPVPIRPASVLRMPKYTMSPEEASKLVDYFAATAGAEFPYSSHPRSRSVGLEAKEQARPHRLDDAMRIVIDRVTFCTKCHLVGDYGPGGETRTVLAPRLDQVGPRIRPDYLRRWLANPRLVLPYTGMPVNFPPTGAPMGQDSFEGSSLEQLDAVADLLLNYDWYIKGRTSIREMIEAAEKANAADAAEEQ